MKLFEQGLLEDGGKMQGIKKFKPQDKEVTIFADEVDL